MRPISSEATSWLLTCSGLTGSCLHPFSPLIRVPHIRYFQWRRCGASSAMGDSASWLRDGRSYRSSEGERIAGVLSCHLKAGRPPRREKSRDRAITFPGVPHMSRSISRKLCLYAAWALAGIGSTGAVGVGRPCGKANLRKDASEILEENYPDFLIAMESVTLLLPSGEENTVPNCRGRE